MMGLPRLSARSRRRAGAARLQISNDRESGERRSARLERRTPRRDKDESEMAEMLAWSMSCLAWDGSLNALLVVSTIRLKLQLVVLVGAQGLEPWTR